MKRLLSNLPNVITTLNLLSGCMACIFSFRGEEVIAGLPAYAWAWIFIGAAAVFDFCDGASARMLHAYSAIGKELDSLADLVSFGLAPAFVMFNLMSMYNGGAWISYTALVIPALGAIRLAKFNVDDSQTTSFKGLPIPANAIFWIGYSSWIHQYNFYPGSWFTTVLMIIISLAMVSRIPMFSLKFKNFDIKENFRRYVIIFAAIAFVIFNGISGLAWTIILYIVMSIALRNRQQTV
jgi:CDP-diacylglycerol--serine O-phosphatidyltransferase